MTARKRWNLVAALGLLALLPLTIPAPAQEPASGPTTRPGPTDPQRLNDLITLIEGLNKLDVRCTGAREVLRLGWTETAGRLTAILNGQNAEAKTAIALALADVPEYLDETYIEPLLNMLGDADAEARRAAATALAGYRNGGVTPRLRQILLNETQPVLRRLGAIDALGMMTRREAVSALVEALRDPNGLIAQAALRALEQITAMSFGDDLARAEAWWNQRQNLPEPEWQRDQINRLVQKDRDLSRRLRELEGRLVDAFREDYMKAKETERGALLQSYLADGSALVRLLGLELVQSQLGEGKTLSSETAAQVRALLTDAEADVRAAAVQAVARLREKPDAARFLELLGAERQVKVRRALINGLGYVGGGGVVEPLLAIVRVSQGSGSGTRPTTGAATGRDWADDPCLTEAIAALGRLAERRVLTEEARNAIADVLLSTFHNTSPGQTALRERVLWAMSLVADPRFEDAFIRALSESEGGTVRLAAVRAIATLKNLKLADALLPLVRETDAALRRAVVETLAEVVAREEHLEALWSRLDPAQEADESIRRTAWRGCVRFLGERSAAEVERWLARLPRGGPDCAAHSLDLLQLMEASLSSNPEKRGELGRVRARIAAQRAAGKQLDEAVTAYVAALGDLRAVQAPEAPAVARELLRFALLNARYDETVAAALADLSPPLDAAALWQGVKVDIEQRLAAGQVDVAIAMLEALRARPPAMFPPQVVQEVEQMLERAQALRGGSPSSAPASRPSNSPA